jgi:hypothetical protein
MHELNVSTSLHEYLTAFMNSWKYIRALVSLLVNRQNRVVAWVEFGNHPSSINCYLNINISTHTLTTALTDRRYIHSLGSMETPWDDDAGFSAKSEWSKISNEFTNVAIQGCLLSCYSL